MRSLIGTLVNRSPVPLSPARGGGIFNIFGRGIENGQDDRYLKTMGSVGTIFAIVSKLATAVAKADWTLYQSAPSGLKEDRVPITDPRQHDSIRLWNKPNPWMNRRRFVETAQQHVELVGENALITAHTRIGKNDVPIELWPVKPSRIQVVPDPYDFIRGYAYSTPDGEKMPLEANELLRMLLPNPYDPYRGMGPVQTIMVDTQNIESAREWNRAFFENSAEPGGVIQVPTVLNDREFDRMRDQWEDSHKGVNKAHRVAILEADAKWVQAGYSHRDMQFTELRTLGRDVILEAWGMNKFMIGVVDDVNRAQAEAAEYVFAKWMVEERLDRWRDLLNFELMPQYGASSDGKEWDYTSPVPENGEADARSIEVKSAALALLAEKGFDVAETLAYLGLPEIGYERPAAPEPAPSFGQEGEP